MVEIWDTVTCTEGAGDNFGRQMVFLASVYWLNTDGSNGSRCGTATLQRLRRSNTRFRLQLEGSGAEAFIIRWNLPETKGIQWIIDPTTPAMTKNGNRIRRSLIDGITFEGSLELSKLQVTMPLVSGNCTVAKMFRSALVFADQCRQEEHM